MTNEVTPPTATEIAPLAGDAIMDVLREKLTSLDIHRACIVDDAFSPGIDVAGWSRLVEVARDQDDELYERIDELVSAETGDVERPPSDVVLLAVRRLAAASASAAVKGLLGPAPADPALESLAGCLQELGLEVTRHWRVEDAPRDVPLYFVDYRLRPESEDGHGRDASRLLSDALQNTGPLGKAPGAVLMSRSQGQVATPNQAEQDEVVRGENGFVKCNFRYVDKALLDDKQRLLFLLRDLLGSMPVGRDYYQQVRALENAAQRAMSRVAGEAWSLVPVDFRVFAARLGGEPQNTAGVAEHLLSIFTGLLVAELRNNPDIQTTIHAFRELLGRPGMMAPQGVASHSLHRIHSRLIYDQSRYALEGPLAFGDIFASVGRPGTYLLLLAPECDLEPRELPGGERGPKVDRVLVVPGTPGGAAASGDDTVAATPLFIDRGDGEARWMRWDLRRPQFVPWRRLKRYKRWSRLRAAEAEQIQLRVASDLLAVGTDDVSGHILQRPAALWQVGNNKDQCKWLAHLEIYELASPGGEDKPLWALAPAYEHELSGAGRAVLSVDAVCQLREYMLKGSFTGLLKAQHVGIHDDKATIHVGWYTGSYRPQSWPGPPKPPAVADTPPAGADTTSNAKPPDSSEVPHPADAVE